jgi:hypothetical protein
MWRGGGGPAEPHLRREERREVLLDEGEDEHVAHGRERRDHDGGEEREGEQVAARAAQREHLALLQARALEYGDGKVANRESRVRHGATEKAP